MTRERKSVPPEIKKTFFEKRGMIPLDRIEGLPTAAMTSSSTEEESASSTEQIMEQGTFYSCNCRAHLSGEEARGVDNFYNGADIDTFPPQSS